MRSNSFHLETLRQPLVLDSSGAMLAAVAQKLPRIAPGSTVLGFNCDTGERSLSIEGFLPIA